MTEAKTSVKKLFALGLGLHLVHYCIFCGTCYFAAYIDVIGHFDQDVLGTLTPLRFLAEIAMLSTVYAILPEALCVVWLFRRKPPTSAKIATCAAINFAFYGAIVVLVVRERPSYEECRILGACAIDELLLPLASYAILHAATWVLFAASIKRQTLRGFFPVYLGSGALLLTIVLANHERIEFLKRGIEERLVASTECEDMRPQETIKCDAYNATFFLYHCSIGEEASSRITTRRGMSPFESTVLTAPEKLCGLDCDSVQRLQSMDREQLRHAANTSFTCADRHP